MFGMDSIEKAKAEADEAYRMKVYEKAVEAYSRAIGLSEDQQRPDLLHLLYSNRWGSLTGFLIKLSHQSFEPSIICATAYST